MQASVHRFDEETGEGSVLLDDGRERPFGRGAFEASGLRYLRVGQRLSVETDDDAVVRLWIVGIGEGQTIA